MKLLSRIFVFILFSTLALLLPASASPVTDDDRIPPVSGSVLRGFDVGEFNWLPGHRGVDLAASQDSELRAAWKGVVAWIGVIDQVPSISINHPDGTRTTYQPVIASVAVGEPVVTGQVIGRVTGTHCEPASCLHWGVKRGEKYLDPLLWLSHDVAKVRLLPSDAKPRASPPISTGSLATSPSPGPITSGFGTRINPISGRSEFHDGVDIGASCGTPVVLQASGSIVRAGAAGGYGLRVEVDHGDGTLTSYSHLSAIKVVVGEKVSAGSVLGEVGTTGFSTGCHLHYSLVRNGISVDPLAG